MRKKMIAMLFVLILTLSGCADVSTAPEESDNYELVTETEAAAETESTESSSFSESKDSESAISALRRRARVRGRCAPRRGFLLRRISVHTGNFKSPHHGRAMPCRD